MEEKKVNPLYRVVRWFVWLFSPKFRAEGEPLPAEPCVIVGNHSQMYGPIAGEIFMPGRHYVWCAGEMMNKDEVADYAYRDFWSGKPKGVRWLFRLFSYLIVPVALLVFNNANTIAVYHDMRVIATFRESVAKLQAGSNVIIFPECYTEHNHIVHDFQEKFIDLARFYHKKTGKNLSFVPVYIAPALKKMVFGAPVAFRPDAPIAEERARLCGALMDAITAMAEAQPRHRVVPYPNVPKRDYPMNIPDEVCDDE